MWVKRGNSYEWFNPKNSYTTKNFSPFQPDKPRRSTQLGYTGVFENFDAYLRPPLYLELIKVNRGVASRYLWFRQHEHIGRHTSTTQQKWRWRKQRDQFYNWLFKNRFPKYLRDKIIKDLNSTHTKIIL